ncbi:hypothetical protein B0H14DRAFT_2833546 [Mycena olivaceomarginata]|nr:hypothetical protein B0H14DRAFT_2833546 [Mycena olivaceomarginata]
MPYAPANTISDAEFDQALAHLEPLLFNLPSDLPLKDARESTFAVFCPASRFVLDEKYFSLTECEVSTLSEMLKRSTGDGIVNIAEQGPAICAVHTVLRDFYVRHPGNNVLRKWVLDIIAGAEKVYTEFGVEMPPPPAAKQKAAKRKEPEGVKQQSRLKAAARHQGSSPDHRKYLGLRPSYP